MNPNPKQQLIERLQSTTNVLITVSANPSVDQLAACIGLTLFLNKMGKHATAVFSGKVPSTIEFLKPEDTLEKNTNSLRDFIIALDKSKADKLRYKVEDRIVKIFITPYRTSLSEKDFEFGQGDFNVDVVVALGVKVKEDLDRAITAHGRILHDATVVSVNNGAGNNTLGTINWNDAQTSSLCEMVTDLVESLQPNNLDAQMSTALLTGIVAETARFSNNKTTPLTMSLSSKLMAAGANQQLVASKLQQGSTDKSANTKSDDIAISADGTLEIEHEGSSDTAETPDPPEAPTPQPVEPIDETPVQEVEASLNPEDTPADLPAVPEPSPNQAEDTMPLAPLPADLPTVSPARPTDFVEPTPSAEPIVPTSTPSLNPQGTSRLTVDPPTLGGTLTANSRPEDLDPSTDPLSASQGGSPILTHKQPNPNAPVINNEPLSRVEAEVGSPHVAQAQSNDVQPSATPVSTDTTTETQSPEAYLDAAREAVEAAASQATPARLDPVASLGAQPLDLNVQGIAPPTSVADNLAAPATPLPVENNAPIQPIEELPPAPVGGQVDATMPSPMAMPAPLPNASTPPAPINPLNLPGNLTSQAPTTEQTGVSQPPSPAPPVPPPMMPPV